VRGEWIQLAEDVVNGRALTRDEALEVLGASDDDLLELLQGAFRIRAHYFGRSVDLHVIANARSGACTEDCAFCSQSKVATTDIAVYGLQSPEVLLDRARKAVEVGARRVCLVTSGRGPSDSQIERLAVAVRRIREETPLQICASLGILTDSQARRLAEAGVNRYNHNLETSERFFPNICSTHTWRERWDTLWRAKAAGLELCCGGLIGMGESDADRVDLAFAIRELGVHSVPVNFLDPRPGTPLEGRPRLRPTECLRILAMFRFVLPDREIRIAGGRETCLRSLQPLALWVANSMFTEGYLTTPGQGWERDRGMLEDAGFHPGQYTWA
jgi:biotin synthase